LWGGGAILVDPENSVGAAAIINDSLNLFAQKRIDGLKNSANYSSGVIVRAYIAQYKQICDRPIIKMDGVCYEYS